MGISGYRKANFVQMWVKSVDLDKNWVNFVQMWVKIYRFGQKSGGFCVFVGNDVYLLGINVLVVLLIGNYYEKNNLFVSCCFVGSSGECTA